MRAAVNSGGDARPVVLTLMGATASGKTALAIELVQSGQCEIISVDSALVYRGMDIGTAKPDAQELELAPHRLIDIRNPDESYSAADFRRDALAEIEAIIAMGKTPLLVGGTMLYFKALIDGLSPLPRADAAVREEIAMAAKKEGWQRLHQQLQQLDPEAAARIHPNDPQRISRALEVCRITGKSMTELLKVKSQPLPYQVVQFAVALKDRKILHTAIEKRFNIMLKQGFIEEVRALKARGDLHMDLPSMRSVGYRQVWRYLDHDYGYETMIEKSLAATRQLAKRQLTWLRGWKDINWLETGDESNLTRVMQHCR